MGDFVDKLVIDRQKVKDVFAKYTSNYDADNDKIKLKIEHTYRVADLCDKIASNIGMSAYETDMAWLIGILHDVGRFEQLRKYGTFSDADSIDHAHYAVEILFDNGEIAGYIGDNRDTCNFINQGYNNKDNNGNLADIGIIRKAIWNHSAYRIEEGLDKRTMLFCNIIRDADKIDIFKVINDTPVETIYKVNSEEVFNSEVSEEVMQALREQHAVLRSLKKTPVDHIAGHIALAFELVFPVSIYITKKQGYLEKLMNFGTCNNRAEKQFQEIREIMSRYMEKYGTAPGMPG